MGAPAVWVLEKGGAWELSEVHLLFTQSRPDMATCHQKLKWQLSSERKQDHVLPMAVPSPACPAALALIASFPWGNSCHKAVTLGPEASGMLLPTAG